MVSRHGVDTLSKNVSRIQKLFRPHILPASYIHTDAHIEGAYVSLQGLSRNHKFDRNFSSWFPQATFRLYRHEQITLQGSSTCRCFATVVGREGDDGVGLYTDNGDQIVQNLILQELIASKEEIVSEVYKRVYIAVGANVGDRFQNLMKALVTLEETTMEQIDLSIQVQVRGDVETRAEIGGPLIRIIRTSFLRETEPMYIKDQPSFLNGAVEIETKLSPHALLLRLKDVESQIGRDFNGGVRYGPRPIDLDILYYGIREDCTGSSADANADADVKKPRHHGGDIVQSSCLEVPHPRIHERDFVLSPLCDLDKNLIHPLKNLTSQEMLSNLNKKEVEAITSEEEDDQVGGPPPPPTAIKVIPLPGDRMLSFDRTHIMGILNVTPDSFSDGGNYDGSVDKAVEQAVQLIEDGATIIDIGGESTRPGAKEVQIEIEYERTIPVIRRLREVDSGIPISIDTRHASVAKAAIQVGADIVNDVSGGTHDIEMLDTVGKLKVPMIIMHMRGTPETMQSLTRYNDVVSEVSLALMKQSEEAAKAGIPRWIQILDPGIGFAKDFDQNLSLLKHCHKMRNLVGDIPLLIGTSRKGFIGEIVGEEVPENRDFGTLASCMPCVVDKGEKLAPTILRVHNVKGVRQGMQIIEEIIKAK